MQTDWRCRWLKSNTNEVYRTQFRCRLYRLEFRSTRRALSLQLSTLDHIKKDSSLATLSGIYSRHGHHHQNNNNNDRRQENVGPRPELPLIHLHRQYDLLAINGSDLERSVTSQLDPEFRLGHLVRQFCDQYNVHWSRTFPSLRHDIGNNRPVKTSQTDFTEEDDDDRIYVFDTDNSLYHDFHSDREPVKKRIKLTLQEENIDNYDVLIPLCLLPLVLDLMPGYFQQVNNIGEQCMRMRETLLLDSTLGLYPRHVQDQLELLRHNCHALGFLGQQARFQLRESKTEVDESTTADDINELHQKEISHLLLQIQRMHDHMALLNEKLNEVNQQQVV